MRKLRRARTGPRLGGTLRMPGDKSISHRALIFAALADGRSRLAGLNDGADVASTRVLVSRLGAAVEDLNDVVEVEGFGSAPAEPAEPLDCGNSGTTMRTLLGVLAGSEGAFFLTGDDSLRNRPMLRVVAPLRQMGAAIDGREHGDRAPLFVRGRPLQGIEHISTIASAQIKTAVLLAGLNATGSTEVTEPHRSRDHTERMLAALGVPLSQAGTTVTVEGGTRPGPFELSVPGDVSAAAFFLTAALLLEGSDLTIAAVGTNPTRMGFVDVLRDMGGAVEVVAEATSVGEPVGSIRARSSGLSGVSIDPAQVPRLVDEVPILAVAATQAHGPTVFEGVGELRVKESDRITAVAEGLRRLGAEVSTGPDSLTVVGPTPLTGGSVDSFGDHRIAMAFAIAGLLTEDKVTVRGWSSVDVSFPGFLGALERARGGGTR